ncbi:hypothetical protein L210DRAFT_3538319 [Boletus edulis BED1]|uniref:Uncharacterized protein n=1 Tax=Boletus edulis BED1 TaxID=1328754 RepID=A0AAD4GFE7_BOLED|nr:hypothetical protein L210DRAFT_3538319 [Boletus edulis BED1]
MTVIGIQIAGCIMFFRVRALYNRRKIVIWSIIVLFLVWLGVNAWLLASGEAVPHISGVHSCTMIFNASPRVASASAWLPLLYDTCIFTLILYKTKNRSGHLVRTLLSDGIQYYSVLCMVNTVLTIMIVQAGPGIKNITAQLELLLTVAMVSRITLNLRKQASEDTVLVMASWMSSKPPRNGNAARTAGTRSRGNSVASVMPRKNSIAFRSEPVSHLEDIRLSVRYTPSTRPDIRASTTRVVAEVEGDVEAV